MKTLDEINLTPTAQILAEMAYQLVGIIYNRKLINAWDLSPNYVMHVWAQVFYAISQEDRFSWFFKFENLILACSVETKINKIITLRYYFS